MDNQLGIIDIIFKVIGDFAAALPSLIGAIIVLIVGWIVGKVVYKMLSNILGKLGVDTAAEKVNQIDFIKNAKIKLIPSKIIPGLIYYIILLIFAMVATEVLGMPVVSKMMADLVSFIPNLIAAFILFVIGIVIADFLKKITLAACNSLGIPSGRVVSNFVFYLVFLTMAITALEQASIQTSLISTNLTILVAGLVGAFSIGYGLASKDTMSNYLASFYTKNKVKVGDVIRVSGVTGDVMMVDSSSLTIQTEDRLVIIPLKKLTSENLEILSN